MIIIISSVLGLLVFGIIGTTYMYYKNKNNFFDAYNEILPVFQKFTDKEHYLTGSERDHLSELADSNDFIEFYKKQRNSSYVNNDEEIRNNSALIYNLATQGEEFRSEHNKKVLRLLKSKYTEFLCSRLEYPLDEQQRNAILIDEDNTLVISSAGSGKTSTIVGKTYYLIEKMKVDPKRILLITFTRKAAADLSERLNIKGLCCKTFHKTAKDIFAKHNGKQPNYADDLNFDVEATFREMLKNDSGFRKKLVDFMLFHIDSEEQHEYTSSEKYFADRAANDSRSLVPDYESIRYTKSNQEKRIFHYLFTLGVSFAYERAYEIDVRTSEHRQYKPDFTIAYKVGEKYKYLYFEHFAINKEGKTPEWFEDGQKYIDDMFWKKKLHKKNGTNLVYTTSADFEDKTWKTKIDSFLEEYRINTSPRTQEEIEEALGINKYSRIKPISEMISSFINLMKAGNYNLDSIKKEIEENKDEQNKIIIENLIEPVYTYYQKRLKELDAIDFADSIKLATQICKKGNKEVYDYILVDEFQDISMDRYKFLQSLRQSFPLTKLFCVGDDWQSIYRFTGSDMALFYDFSKYFGYTEERKIERTYRFGEPLISLSSNFIQENPNQKKKDVICGISDARTEYEFIEYEVTQDGTNKEYEAVEKIVSSLPENSSIFILARYTFSDQCFPKANKVVEGKKIIYNIASRRCTFLTAHSSKGLEADYIIVIGCTSGVYGFPSRVANHKVLSYVMSKSDDFLYSEDRRLFYVAMTRAKKKTFFVYPSKGESEFIKDINPVKGEDDICPLCKAGKMKLRRSGTSRNGNEWNFYACDNYIARCPHTQIKWKNKIRIYGVNGNYIEVTEEEYKSHSYLDRLSEINTLSEEQMNGAAAPRPIPLPSINQVPPMPAGGEQTDSNYDDLPF